MVPTLDIRKSLIILGAGFGVLVVYLAGMAPGIFWRDSMEFCLIGHLLDIGHPAGSPAFSLLAKPLAMLPLGSIAWRANLLSALASVAAFVLLWLAAAAWLDRLRVLPANLAWAVAGIAAASFAFSTSFWAWGEVAEVYSLQVAFLSALLWLAALVSDDQVDVRLFGAIGLLLGLSCGVHMVQILYVPAFGALLWRGGLRVHWRGMFLMAGAFLVGFSVFAYLPVRSLTQPPYDYGNPESWPAFLAQITGKKYAHVIHSFPWRIVLRNLSLLPGHIVRELNPVIAVGAFIGVIALARVAPRRLLFFALILVGHLYLYIKDWWRPFGYIPVFLLAALTGGIGLGYVIRWLTPDRGRRRLRRVAALLWVVTVAAALFGVFVHVGYCARTTHDLAQRHGRGILDSLPTNAVLVGFHDSMAYNTFYQQNIERWRPDVHFVHRAWLPFPEELLHRFPNWNVDGYDPDRPFDAERMLTANAGSAGVYWDYGWEDRRWIDQTHLEPYGMTFRLTDHPWDGQRPEDDAELWRLVYRPIMLSRLVAPRGYDWTAEEVYAKHFHLLAKLHADARRWDLAREASQRAIRIAPDFAEYYASLALTDLALGEFARAKDLLDYSVQLDPLCAMCRSTYGRLRLRLNDSQGAIAEFLSAESLGGLDVTTSILLGRLLLENERASDAVTVLRRTLRRAVAPSDLVQVRFLAAAAYLRTGDCDRVVEQTQHLRELEPDHPAIPMLLDSCGR